MATCKPWPPHHAVQTSSCHTCRSNLPLRAVLCAMLRYLIFDQVGRVLGAMELQSTEINTRGFEALLKLVENTNNDSFDLYYGLFLYNQVRPGSREEEGGGLGAGGT